MKADHKQIVRLLKTARGQIDGILGMVEEDRSLKNEKIEEIISIFEKLDK